ncbi:MAG: AraC family transcriptional regulator [Oscillospiraceae bacterium]|nr:AraC family transcriptional regulator [Oscillospiraceae bacterium]
MEKQYSIQSCTIGPEERRTFRAGGDYLMLLPMDGSCQALLEEGETLCTTTDMLLLQPRRTLTLWAGGLHHPCTLTLLRVPPETLRLCSDETCDLSEKYAFIPFGAAVIRSEIGTVTLLKNLLARLSSIEREELQLGLSIYESSLLSVFLVVFLRVCVQGDRVHRRQRKKELLTDDVSHFIRENLTGDLSLQRLEKEFYVSGEHLSRVFRKSAGISLHAYILRSRIDLSKKYILQGMPIKDVAVRCGFGSYNHFFKAFKKECGMTPKAYYKASMGE